MSDESNQQNFHPTQTKRKYHNWKNIINEWQVSGKSKTEFCADRSISASQLYKAINRMKKDSHIAFIKTKLVKPASIAQHNLEIELGNNVTASIKNVDPVTLIKSLIAK